MKIRNYKIETPKKVIPANAEIQRFQILLPLILCLLTISLLISCKDTGSKSAGNGFGPGIVVDCTIPGNEQKPDCIQKCVLDPTLSWCETEEGPKFTCPVDGSFKAVNPFNGQELTFSDSPGSLSDIEGFLAAKPFSDGEFSTLFLNENSKLYINATTNISLENTTSKDLVSNITSIDAAEFGGKYYAVIGTAEDFKIVEFYKGPTGKALFRDESTIEYKKLGGIKQVLITNAVDLSGDSATTLPGGMQVALSAPPPGTTVEESEEPTDETFVYLLNYEGSVWRIKLQHLLNGGCFEMIYDINDEDNKDGDRHMVGRKFAAEGEQLAILTSTMDSELKDLDPEAEREWNDFFLNYTIKTLKKYNKLTSRDYYWLINHITKPLESKERIKTLNILKTTRGNFNEIKHSLSTRERYHATDIAVDGTKLYIAAFKYDLKVFHEDIKDSDDNTIKKPADLEIVKNMQYLLMHSVEGPTSDQSFILHGIAFRNASNTILLTADISDPNSISSHNLPKMAQSATPSIYTTISLDENDIYFRGTFGLFGKINKTNLNEITSSYLSGPSKNLVPWFCIYDAASQDLLSAFFFNFEITNVGTNTVTTIE